MSYTKISFVIVALALSASVGYACQDAFFVRAPDELSELNREIQNVPVQNVRPSLANPTASTAPTLVRPRWTPGQNRNLFIAGHQPIEQRFESRIVAAAGELKEIESDDEKQEKIAEIKELLETEYEKYLKSSESKLEEMEKRLEKLRNQINRRRKAKDRMVELRLEMIVSQAEGIGWPEPEAGNPLSRWPSTPAVPSIDRRSFVPNVYRRFPSDDEPQGPSLNKQDFDRSRAPEGSGR